MYRKSPSKGGCSCLQSLGSRAQRGSDVPFLLKYAVSDVIWIISIVHLTKGQPSIARTRSPVSRGEPGIVPLSGNYM